MGKAIQDYNVLYSGLRPLVQFGTRCHYFEHVIKGKENIPSDGGYIYAPCHQQALMEPLVVLHLLREKPVFLARADIFSKPLLKAFFTFLRILPVYRIRDGRDSLNKNTEIFEKSRNVILDGYPLCLMAEGRHNNRHQLLPLVKGMFRIAGETQLKLGSKPLYIIPTGLDYDEYERPYANVVVNIGKPIPVQDYIQTYQENEPLALNQMRQALTESLKEKMHHIASQEYYDEFLTLCKFENPEYRKARGLSNNAWNRFQMRQQIAHDLDALEAEAKREDASEESKQRLQEKLNKAHKLQKMARKKGVPESVAAEKWSAGKLALSLACILGVVAACVFVAPIRWLVLFSLMAYPLPFLPTHLIAKKLIKDTQFRSSVNFGIRLMLTLIYMTIISIVMATTCGGWLGDVLGDQYGFDMHWFLWGLLTYCYIFLLARLTGPAVCWIRGTWDNIKLRIR